MVEKDIVIQIKDGLHARPAADMIKGLKQFSSAVELSVGEKQYNAKSILSMMSASIKQGETVKVKIDGNDEDEAMAWMGQFLSDGR
jgi:catabolite repression HPr-like protein